MFPVWSCGWYYGKLGYQSCRYELFGFCTTGVSCVRILSKSDRFEVGVGFLQDPVCCLHEKGSQGTVKFEDCRTASLLFGDDVVPLVSSN